ncbi:MAG: TonB-dependent receptor plug domain-containing protein, partial [Gallionella sp.]
MNRKWTAKPMWLTCMLALSTSLSAETFTLGEVTVTATRPQVGEIGADQVSSVVTQKDMQQFNRSNVGDALNLLSGVTLTNSGMRNEKMIYVRGFDARQVPLFIDGIPIYVPYDGYVDLNRFTTADLSSIQVSKGFSSVSYGPNTLGGAINLLSRKPKQRFEGDAMVGFASGNERQAQANVGTNQGLWYLQAGTSYLKSDSYPLSSSFTPTATEDGGARNNSSRKDDKISLKVGLTPNASDEYALSYYKQHGEKGQPPSTIPATARYWKWPFWDKESLYFLSNTALGDKEKLKVRLYLDKYGNGLDIYANATYPTITNP